MAGMVLAYGSYRHDPGEADVRLITETPVYNEAGFVERLTVGYDILGQLLNGDGGSQAALSTKIQNLRTAYSFNNRDLILYLADGTTPSAHLIRTNETLGGTRVVQRSFPSEAAEYVNHRSYTVRLEADYPAFQSQYTFFSETIEFVGTGGPRVRHVESLFGRPKPDELARFTICRAYQYGTVAGRYAIPPLPPPKWPQFENVDLRFDSATSPEPLGIGGRFRYGNFPRTYRYTFESPFRLSGVPAIWNL